MSSIPTISLPSVQSLLIVLDYNGAELGTGTGFVVQSSQGPVLMTNRHNVTGRHQDTNQPLHPSGGVPSTLKIVHNKSGHLGAWVLRDEPLYSGSAPNWIEHPALGAAADAVALPLTALNDVEIYPYPLSNSPAIQFGPADVVSVIGFPFGIQAGGSLAVWATGFIASEPSIDFSNRPVFLIDCRSRPGQSGSAVVAHRNGGAVAMEGGGTAVFAGAVTRLLGIYSGRINQQSDLGIVWKLSAISELVASV